MDGILAVQSRIAHIESKLGIERPMPVAGTARATTTSSSAAVFEDVLARLQGPTAAAPTTGTAGLADVPYADLFRAAGARHGVDPALLAAVAGVESGYDPRAVSPAGARGLMQLMPATARGLGVADSFDPAQAVDGAARMLAGLLEQFGSTELALAAYNAGPGAVTRHGGIPPYAETQRYVPKVIARYEELSA